MLIISSNGVLDDIQWTFAAGSTSVLLNSPTDVMLDPMGNMYVVDRGNHRIQFFKSGQLNGTTITTKIGYNTTMLNNPTSLTLDNQLNLYVVDRLNQRIQKILRY